MYYVTYIWLVSKLEIRDSRENEMVSSQVISQFLSRYIRRRYNTNYTKYYMYKHRNRWYTCKILQTYFIQDEMFVAGREILNYD